MVLTFAIDSSVDILDSSASVFEVHLGLQLELQASMLAFVLDENLRLQFKFWRNFELRASRSSTASVFAFGL